MTIVQFFCVSFPFLFAPNSKQTLDDIIFNPCWKLKVLSSFLFKHTETSLQDETLNEQKKNEENIVW